MALFVQFKTIQQILHLTLLHPASRLNLIWLKWWRLLWNLFLFLSQTGVAKMSKTDWQTHLYSYTFLVLTLHSLPAQRCSGDYTLRPAHTHLYTANQSQDICNPWNKKNLMCISMHLNTSVIMVASKVKYPLVCTAKHQHLIVCTFCNVSKNIQGHPWLFTS